MRPLDAELRPSARDSRAAAPLLPVSRQGLPLASQLAACPPAGPGGSKKGLGVLEWTGGVVPQVHMRPAGPASAFSCRQTEMRAALHPPCASLALSAPLACMQGMLVKTAKYGWRTAWKTLMTELAPQVLDVPVLRQATAPQPTWQAREDSWRATHVINEDTSAFPPAPSWAAEQGRRLPAAAVQLPGSPRQRRFPTGARQARLCPATRPSLPHPARPLPACGRVARPACRPTAPCCARGL